MINCGELMCCLLLFMLILVEIASAEIKNLDTLLQEVKQARTVSAKENAQREAVFKAQLDQRDQLLQQAKVELAKEKYRLKKLQKALKKNKKKLDNLETDFSKNSTELDRLFSVARQAAGEMNAICKHSVVSAQFPGREVFLQAMAGNNSLPSIKDFRQLWFEMQRQMTESGKVSRFSRLVITRNGQEKEQMVVRVGEFNVISNGTYLQYLPKSNQLVELAHQPPPKLMVMAKKLANAQQNYHAFSLDPSQGTLLTLLSQTPGVKERVHQGGVIGYVILGLGILALLISLERFIYLGHVGFKINRQKKSEQVSTKNPLGRILQTYQADQDQDVEMLSLKLDEAILRETPNLEQRLVILGIVAAICPLLGLLGTVMGMIETFQSIAIFGTGDPKLMSGGISQALVTTGLGLIVAIPVILLHSFLQSKSNGLIQILDEESAGLVAQFSEQQKEHKPVQPKQI